MPDEACVSPSWEHSVDPNGVSPGGSNHISPNLSHTPPTTDSTFPTSVLSSPPPRSSSESVGRTPSSKWRESHGQSTLERRDTITTITTNPETTNVAEPSFDENVLRMLCDLDVSGLLSWGSGVCGLKNCARSQCSIPLLLDRIKQSTASCKVCLPFHPKLSSLNINHFRRRRRFSSRRGPCWRTSMAKTCKNWPARRLNSMG